LENGLITFHCPGENPRLTVRGDGLLDVAEAIETARRITLALGDLAGDADIYLTEWGYEDGYFVLQFGYYLGGIPIWTEYPAATVVIWERYVREVTLFARNFHRSEQVSAVIPELQAAAAVTDGATLVLTYVAVEDAIGGQAANMHARWLIREVQHG